MEDHMEQPYIVYAKTDDAGVIRAVNSSAFLADTDGWTQIDSGYGDRYHHAQGYYLPGTLLDERGVPRYKLADGKLVERTQEEIDADYAPPVTGPTQEERLARLESAVSEMTAMLRLLLGLGSEEGKEVNEDGSNDVDDQLVE